MVGNNYQIRERLGAFGNQKGGGIRDYCFLVEASYHDLIFVFIFWIVNSGNT